MFEVFFGMMYTLSFKKTNYKQGPGVPELLDPNPFILDPGPGPVLKDPTRQIFKFGPDPGPETRTRTRSQGPGPGGGLICH